MPTTLSPEYRLLTRAAVPGTTAVSPGPVERVDWDLVVELAARHRLGPLLGRYLNGAGIDAPEVVVAGLTLDRLRAAAGNMRLAATARTVVGALAEAGVPAMGLKGLVLHETVYRDVSLRPMVDLDFLVPDASIQRAEDVLLGLGYRSARPAEAGQPLGPRGGKYAYPILVSPDGLVHVDLHRHVLPDASFDIGQFWDHGRPSREGGHLLPDHEDLLIHLAGHFFRDRIPSPRGTLLQLADMAWTTAAAPVDWDVVVRRALAYGLHGRVFLAFVATNELVAPVVPAEVLDALRPASYSAAMGRVFVQRRLLGSTTRQQPGDLVRPASASFARRRRPFRRLFPDRAYLVQHHGQWAGPDASYGRLLAVRAGRALPGLRPWRRYRDARLNRWMRTVAAEGRSVPTEA